MRSSEEKELLHDVIAEGDYAQFRAELFRSTSKEFRRQHRKSRAKAWLALAAMLMLSAVLGLKFLSGKRVTVSVSVAPTPEKSATPAPSVEMVSTKPLPDLDVVRTVPNQALIVRTRISFPEISDSQLLVLLKDRSAGFVEGKDGRRYVVMSAKSVSTGEGASKRGLQ